MKRFYVVLLGFVVGLFGLLPACSEDTESCGGVEEGGACESDDQCGCGMKCRVGACLLTYEAVAAPTNSSSSSGGTTTPSVTPAIRQLCQEASSLSCLQELFGSAADCETLTGTERAKALQGGCGAQFDAVIACYNREDLSCDDSAAPCSSERATADACECQKGSLSDSYSPNVGGEFTEEAPCQITAYNDCSWSAAASCVPKEAGVWQCTCTQGTSVDRQFWVDSDQTSACGDFGAATAAACGVLDQN